MAASLPPTDSIALTSDQDHDDDDDDDDDDNDYDDDYDDDGNNAFIMTASYQFIAVPCLSVTLVLRQMIITQETQEQIQGSSSGRLSNYITLHLHHGMMKIIIPAWARCRR